jgi:hypothetical protein
MSDMCGFDLHVLRLRTPLINFHFQSADIQIFFLRFLSHAVKSNYVYNPFKSAKFPYSCHF